MKKIRLIFLIGLLLMLTACVETKSQCWYIDPNSDITPSEACPISQDVIDEAASARMEGHYSVEQNYQMAPFAQHTAPQNSKHNEGKS